MNIGRGLLLSKLNEAAIGLSSKEILEQSNCFIFKDGRLTTFNDDIMVRMASPLDFDMVVNATDLLAILAKIPDDEIEITRTDNEVRINGQRRTAGLAVASEVHLPLDAVPSPVKWSRLGEGVAGLLQQATRTCGKDETQYLATCVHVTPELIEACDNQRLFRVNCTTGFPDRVLIPAASMDMLEGLEVMKVSIGKGWVFFKTLGGAEVALRCSHEDYQKGIDQLLELKEPETMTLPANLKEMVERAEIFNTAAYDARVSIHINKGELTISSRKDGGWYKERKKIRYEGRELEFEINPKFLVEILSRTRDIEVDDRRIKIISGNIQFVVALLMPAVAPAEKKKVSVKGGNAHFKKQPA